MQEVQVQIIKTGADRKEERRKAFIDRAVAMAAIMSAFIAIATAYASHNDAQESLRTQLESVNNQIAVTQATVRPIVVVDPLPPSKKQIVSASEKIVRPSFRITSRGQSPAIAVSYNIDCQTSSDNSLSFIHKKLDSMPPYATLGILSDKDEQSVNCPAVQLDPIGDAAHVGVRVTYFDVFSNTHQITYFFYVNLLKDGLKIGYAEPPRFTTNYARR
jgi:hypothetical protein